LVLAYHRAADDDPSGIANIPLRAHSLEPSFSGLHSDVAVDGCGSNECARIGKVTGRAWPEILSGDFQVGCYGLHRGPACRQHDYIAADLAGMADAAEMLSGVKSRVFVVVFALLISWQRSGFIITR